MPVTERSSDADRQTRRPSLHLSLAACVAVVAWTSTAEPGQSANRRLPYAIVDTGQVRCYSDDREIAYPKASAKWFGQDAQWEGNVPSYTDNGDGTITDLNTGLMWQSDPGAKMTLKQAVAGAAKCRLGGYRDWRLPTITGGITTMWCLLTCCPGWGLRVECIHRDNFEGTPSPVTDPGPGEERPAGRPPGRVR